MINSAGDKAKVLHKFSPCFPQSCSLILETAVSYAGEISIAEKTDGSTLQLTNLEEDAVWMLDATETSWGTNLGKSQFSFNFVLTRRHSWYLINIIFPVIFLCVCAPLVFLMPADAGEKMGTSITVLLSFAVYLTIVSDYLPVTSTTTSILAVYLTVMLGFCAACVVASALVLRLHHTDTQEDPVTDNYRKVTEILRKITFNRKKAGESGASLSPPERSRSSSKVEPVPVETPNRSENGGSVGQIMFKEKTKEALDNRGVDDELTWQEVSRVVDWALFLVFTIAMVAVTLIVMVTLIAGGKSDRMSLIENLDSGDQGTIS